MQTTCRWYAVSLIGLVCLWIASCASASWWDDGARAAVRSEIRSQTDWSRVVFIRASAPRNLSVSTVAVNGEGLATDRPGWGGMPFRYSVTLRRSDRWYTRLHVQFADGTELRGSDEWRAPHKGDTPDVHITSPRWYQVTPASRVLLAGDGRPRADVQVTLYARDGRKAAQRTVRTTARGAWSTHVTLAPGNYRMTAVSGSSEDELRFAVRRQTGSWSNEDTDTWTWDGWLRTDRVEASGRLIIDAPRSGVLVKGPPVWLRGRAADGTVTVSLDHGSHRVYHNEAVPVRRGRWAIRVVLKPGTHRLIVQAGDRRIESKFTVR